MSTFGMDPCCHDCSAVFKIQIAIFDGALNDSQIRNVNLCLPRLKHHPCLASQAATPSDVHPARFIPHTLSGVKRDFSRSQRTCNTDDPH
jgi:hypothetical protein